MTCKPGWGGVGWRNARGEGLSPAAAASVPDQGLSCASRSFNVNLRAVIQVSQVRWLQGRSGGCWVMPALPHPSSAISDCGPRPDSSGSPRGHRECF